jgi:hypothetical protein
VFIQTKIIFAPTKAKSGTDNKERFITPKQC